jgi:peroxiredoxin
MALLYSTASELGSNAQPFSLVGVDGNTYTLDSFKDQKALLVVFMCNHCPYVIAVHERLNQIAKDYAAKGVTVVGINSNDPNYRIEDSFENMQKTAKEWGLVFPYLFDETQLVAKAYDAVCTPDPYLYEKFGGQWLLRYRGRIDDSWKDADQVKDQSLRKAIDALLDDEAVDLNQVPSMGCSIKWKEHTADALAVKAAKAKAEAEKK